MNEIKMPAAFAAIDENEMVYLNGGSITDTGAWKIFLNVGTLFNYVARLMQSLKDTWVNPKLFTSEEMNRVLGTDMEREYSLHALATRPGVTLKAVAGMTKTDGAPVLPLEDFSDDELFQAETEVKYSGYISRQKAEIERTLANETLKIPAELDYDSVPGLSFEVRQKLKSISPETIGQASRISGVTPAAVSLLLVHLKRRYYYVKDKGTQAKEKGNV